MIRMASGSHLANEEITLTDRTPNHELALHVNSAMMKLDADGLIDAISEFMEFHELTANREKMAKIPISPR